MIGNKQTKQKGATLLEIIVAIGIFSIIILSATGIFQSVVDGQRSAIVAQNIQENIRYAMETISREIRMAQKSDADECGFTTSQVYRAETDNTKFIFKNMHGECVEYKLENDVYGITRFKITRDGTGGFITPNEIIVTNLKFNVVDDSTNQPRVSLRMDVKSSTSKKEHKQKMVIQTTISSRDY